MHTYKGQQKPAYFGHDVKKTKPRTTDTILTETFQSAGLKVSLS